MPHGTATTNERPADRQPDWRSDRGEISSWLIMVAGLGLAAAIAVGTLGSTFISLANGVGLGESIPGASVPGAAPNPGNNGDSNAGSGDAGDSGKKDTGAYGNNKRISDWEDTGDPLYRDGIHPDDVSQGALNDCFFVSTLAALANVDPDIIRNAIVDNGDGTFTVTLYDGDTPVEITVTGEAPVAEYYDAETDTWVRSPRRPGAGSGDGEIWAFVLEKAYASFLGDGDLIEGYRLLNQGGSRASAIEVLTGIDATYTSDDPSLDRLRELLAEGPVLATSHEWKPGSGWWIIGRERGNYTVGDNEITTWHQYWVEEILPNGTIIVRNPWDFDGYRLEMTLDEFNEAFRGITYSDQVD